MGYLGLSSQNVRFVLGNSLTLYKESGTKSALFFYCQKIIENFQKNIKKMLTMVFLCDTMILQLRVATNAKPKGKGAKL